MFPIPVPEWPLSAVPVTDSRSASGVRCSVGPVDRWCSVPADPPRTPRLETTTDRAVRHDGSPMSPTVDELRNDIRTAVGRYERVESTAFTKEALAALCEAVDYGIDTDSLPSKPQMRAGILAAIGELETDDPAAADRPFRKAELVAVAAALDESDR